VSVPPAVGLRHVAIRVRDLGRVERFWTELLGYVVEWRPDADNVYLTRSRDNVALHRVATANAAEGTLDHVGIAVARADDVDAWAAHLAAHAVPMDGPPRTHRDGARGFYARDPEGNAIQFIHHAPMSDPGP